MAYKGRRNGGVKKNILRRELRLFSSPNIIRVIKSSMRRARHVARMGDRRGAHRVLVGDVRERKHLEDLWLEGRIREDNGPSRSGMGTWTGLIWFRKGKGGGLL